MKAAVDDVKAVGNATVAGEGEHHAGVGSLESVSSAFDCPGGDLKRWFYESKGYEPD